MVKFSAYLNRRIFVMGSIHIIIFLFLHENKCCGYSLEVPQWDAHNEYQKTYEPAHDKTYNKNCGASKDSDQPIMKTCLYKFDPLQPHFFIVKLGFTGVYIIFLILLNNIDCGYSLEPPRRCGSNEYPQSMFWAEIWKISGVLSENFWVFGGEIFYIFE